MLEGVVVKDLVAHADDRQVFREVIRVTDDFFGEGFGQLSYAHMYTGSAKAWHIHRHQVDWWYVASGTVKLVLYDARPTASTYRQLQEIALGPDHGHKVVRIPPGVAHGCKVLEGPAQLFYVTSRVYSPEDEGRIPHDDPEIGYDWTAPAEIK